LKIDSGKTATIIARIIVTIPLIFVGYMWNPRIITCLLRSPCRPFFDEIVLTTLIDASIILICPSIWFPNSRLLLYLGKIGSIIWLLPMGFYTLMVFGEFEHAEPIALVVYFIVLLSTAAIMISLWKPRRYRR